MRTPAKKSDRIVEQKCPDMQHFSGLKASHTLAHAPEKDELFVTDGDAAGSAAESIFGQDGPDEYRSFCPIPTHGGMTSIYVPEVKQLCIVHPKTEIDDAALLIY